VTNGYWGGSSVKGKSWPEEVWFQATKGGQQPFQFWDGLGRKWEKTGRGETMLIHRLKTRLGSSTVMLDRAKNEESASVRARLCQLPELGDDR
jgi:hypothetical protein